MSPTSAVCCLGVLCDVMMKEKLVEGYWKYTNWGDETRLNFITPNGSNALLPPEDVIRAAFDMPELAFNRDEVSIYRVFATEMEEDTDPSFEDALSDCQGTRLFELNDNGASFSEIADIIEKKM